MTIVSFAVAMISLAVTAIVAGGQARARLGELRAALRNLDAAETSYRSDSARALELYDRLWTIAGESAVSFVRTHPRASAAALAAALRRLNPREAEVCVEDSLNDSRMPDLLGCFRLGANVIRFSDGGRLSYVIALYFGERGRLLVMSRNGRLAGNDIMPVASGSVRSLPDDRKGRHRFYVDSRPGDTTPFGALTCRDLTVWQWDGQRLVQLVRKNYRTPKFSRVQWDGRHISVETRGEIRTLSVSNGDDRLDADLRLRVSSGGVREEPLTYHAPEYALIDDLFLRTLHDRDASDIAAAQAAARLKEGLGSVGEKSMDDCCGAVGDLRKSKIVRSKRGASVDIETWKVGLDASMQRRFHFTIRRRAGRLFVTAVDVQFGMQPDGSPGAGD